MYTTLTPAVKKTEQLFDQTVNVVLYEWLLKKYFIGSRPLQLSESAVQELQLTKDKLNTLRYASGYIAKKKYEKEHLRKKLGIKAEQFEEALGNMTVADEETNFIQCTSE